MQHDRHPIVNEKKMVGADVLTSCSTARSSFKAGLQSTSPRRCASHERTVRCLPGGGAFTIETDILTVAFFERAADKAQAIFARGE
jgi:hypothetical protein